MEPGGALSGKDAIVNEALLLLARMTEEQVEIALAMLSQPEDKAG